MIYLFVIIVISYYSLKRSAKNSRLRFSQIVTVSLIFFSGFRNIWIGNDTYAYLRSMTHSVDASWQDIFGAFLVRYISPSMDVGKDPGYAIFEKCYSTISTDYTFYLLIVATIVIVPISIFIYKNTISLKQMLFVYLYYIVMFFVYVPNSAIRQSLAIGVAHIAFLLFQKNKNIAFILVILLASTFHKTALLCLLFAILVKYAKVNKIAAFTIVGFVVVLVLGNSLSGYLAGLGDIYGAYAEDYYAESGKQKPFLVLFLVSSLYIITLLPKYNPIEKELLKPFIVASTFVMVIVPLVRVDPSYLRLTAYFGMFFAIYVSRSLEKYSLKQKEYYTIILCIFLIKGVTNDQYKFNWQYMKKNERYACIEVKKIDEQIKFNTYVC